MTTNKQLRELAEKAGVQGWGQDKGDVVALGGWPGSSGPLVLASANEHFPEHAINTAAYVSAANPATILALLDAYEALQAECEKLREDAGMGRVVWKFVDRMNDVCPEFDPADKILADFVIAIDAAMQEINHDH